MDQLKYTFIKTGDLAEFLLPFEKPVMEIEILKRFFSFKTGSISSSKLFSMHFSAFNALYRLKYEYGVHGYYVHIDPMRTMMLKPPASGCRHYLDREGSFCGEDEYHEGYCLIHRKYHRKNSVHIDILREFYIDPENIGFGESDLLKKLMNGTVRFAKNRRQIDDARSMFGLNYPTKRRIQTRYRELAKKFHPDKNNGDEKAMKELNRAYEILREIYIM